MYLGYTEDWAHNPMFALSTAFYRESTDQYLQFPQITSEIRPEINKHENSQVFLFIRK